MLKKILPLLLLLVGTAVFSQRDYYAKHLKFTEADTLRGMLRPERTCFDVSFYDLKLKIMPETKAIAGRVDIYFRVVEDFQRMQVDLFENLKISRIESEGKVCSFKRRYNAVFIDFDKGFRKGASGVVRIEYEGIPIAARNAPWDGGFVWKTDLDGTPWISVACEGTGASLWWPNKDHLSDEPDSMAMSFIVPNTLFCASNGNLRRIKTVDENFDQYDWFVSYPINNYDVSFTLGNLVHFSDYWIAKDGDTLNLDYYVLEKNLDKAKIQFSQVHQMLDCYEQYFGKYPFWRDGYSLIETPFLGMEHQSGIAYGNQYKRGYLGGMIPGDMDWDYIIIHESGHEWWGNSVSCTDHAEMWIHESFTTYMEALYVECRYGYRDALRYLASQKSNIRNISPMVGAMGVNFNEFGSSDQYFKGSWMLHTLRHAIANDALFFDILKSYYEAHRMGTTTSQDFIDLVNQKTKKNWDAFFEQYLYYAQIPVFEYKIKKRRKGIKISYRWNADVPKFDMPVRVGKKDSYITLHPSTKWKTVKMKKLKPEDFSVAQELFLIRVTEYQDM